MPVLTRLLVGVPLAAVIAVALFLAMRTLIAMGDLPLSAEREPPQLDIHQKVEEPEPPTRTEIEPPKPVTPPPDVRIRIPETGLPTEDAVIFEGAIPATTELAVIETVSFDPPAILEGGLRIPADYPVRALERGVEGHCVMGFDLAQNGVPVNVRALSCTSSLFERASIKAVERWRYGEGSEDTPARTGLRTTIEYQLAD